MLLPGRLLAEALLVTGTCLLVAGGAPQQTQVALTDLDVDLWPEYDRPAVLVIYRATIAPGTAFPVTVSFRIPADAGAPNAVAEQDATGRLVNVTYRREVDGDRAAIVFTANRPNVQLEYYDPGLERDGAQRRYGFDWEGGYTVGSLSIQVQQPVGAREFRITPSPTSQGPGSDGLVYHTVSVGGLPAGEPQSVAIEYVKDTDTLSVESVAPAGPTTPSPAATGQPTGDEEGVSVVWSVAGLVLALAGGSALAWGLARWRRSAKQVTPTAYSGVSATPRRTGRDRAGFGKDAAGSATQGSAAASSSAAGFCTQCGAAAGQDDRFCHACGARLRDR